MRRISAIILGVALVLCSVSANAAQTPITTAIDLPAQSLADSLRGLAAQTHTNILFERKLVGGRSARPLKANLSLSQALVMLLQDTGLTYRRSDDKTVLIIRKQETSQIPAGAHTIDTLEEVIVTAQKREERVQDVPVSVSVLKARQMLEAHQTRLIDYAATIPGLQVESSSAGNSTLTLRGLALHGDGATVGTYIDDVPFGLSGPGQNARGSALELLPYDLEGIEVLRGPQGTFYGANALGGLIKYVTKVPNLHEQQLLVGTDVLSIDGARRAGYTARIAANTPLMDDRLALRASYGRDYTPGYIDEPLLQRQDVNHTTRQTGNVALLWQPIERLSVKLAALIDRIDSADTALVRLDYATRQPLFGPLQAASSLAQPFRRTEQLYGATVKYDFGWTSLTSISSFSSSKTEVRTDATGVYGPVVTLLTGGVVQAPLVPLDAGVNFRKYTQELRLATANTARIEGLLGAFFTYEDAYTSRQTLQALAADRTPLPDLSPLVRVDAPTSYREEALFGNVTYRISPQFNLSGGARFARNHQQQSLQTSGSLFAGDASRSRASQSVFNYSLAPQWRVTEDLMAYLRVATGYRPGGPNIVLDPASTIPRQYKADRIVNYEAGLKSTWLDHRLDVNVAAFQINWKDVQIGLVDTTTQGGYYDNGKTARSRGLEWESVFRPIRGLRLGLTATWLDAVLTQDLPQNASLIGKTGDRLAAAPPFSGAATVSYSFPLVAKWNSNVGATYQYTGNHYSGVSGDPNTLLLKHYSTLDFNFGAGDDSWSFNLFVRNATNERAYVQEMLLTDFFTLAPVALDAAVLQPRTIGLSVDKRF